MANRNDFLCRFNLFSALNFITNQAVEIVVYCYQEVD